MGLTGLFWGSHSLLFGPGRLGCSCGLQALIFRTEQCVGAQKAHREWGHTRQCLSLTGRVMGGVVGLRLAPPPAPTCSLVSVQLLNYSTVGWEAISQPSEAIFVQARQRGTKGVLSCGRSLSVSVCACLSLSLSLLPPSLPSPSSFLPPPSPPLPLPPSCKWFVASWGGGHSVFPWLLVTSLDLFCLVWGPYLTSRKGYCIQESLLTSLGEHRMQGSNPGWLCARQAPTCCAIALALLVFL